jgi:hypothetical protein
MRAFPRPGQRSRMRWRSYGATPLLCARNYKDVTPTEPFSTGTYDFRSNAKRAPKKIKTPPVIRLSTVEVLG